MVAQSVEAGRRKD